MKMSASISSGVLVSVLVLLAVPLASCSFVSNLRPKAQYTIISNVEIEREKVGKAHLSQDFTDINPTTLQYSVQSRESFFGLRSVEYGADVSLQLFDHQNRCDPTNDAGCRDYFSDNFEDEESFGSLSSLFGFLFLNTFEGKWYEQTFGLGVGYIHFDGVVKFDPDGIPPASSDRPTLASIERLNAMGWAVTHELGSNDYVVSRTRYFKAEREGTKFQGVSVTLIFDLLTILGKSD